jgi:hypothetical protein
MKAMIVLDTTSAAQIQPNAFSVLTLVATLVAAYAAVVATWSLVWQILRARREQRSIVRVRTSWEGGPDGEKVVLQVINYSAHPVKVERWGWFAEGRGSQPQVQIGSPQGIEVPTHDSITIREDRGAALRGIDLVRERVVSWTLLTTGEEFHSEPTPSPRHREIDPRFEEYEARHGKPLPPGETQR